MSAKASPQCDALLVALGDMPELTVELVDSVIEAWRQSDRSILVPTCAGRRGHPVLLSAGHREELLSVAGDRGARDILRAHPDQVELHETGHRGCVFDLDRPADLEPLTLEDAPDVLANRSRRLSQAGIHHTLAGTQLRYYPFDADAVPKCTEAP